MVSSPWKHCSRRQAALNQYGVTAQRHWARFLPTRYSQLEDPDSFFSSLGQEVEEEIDELTQQLAADDPPNEEDLGKLGRLTAAGQQARERVLAERVLLPAEPGSPMHEDSEEPEPDPGERTSEWIPVVEDPSHPWWQEQNHNS